jgi:lysozyme
VAVTEDLIAHIKAEELFMPKPYLDPVGLPTVGYGHRIPDLNHPPMTEAEADALLRSDVARFEAMALRLSPGLKDEPADRLAAITDFCFNAGGAAYAGSVLRLRVNQKNWADAAEQIQRWVYGGPIGHKVVLPGLVKRRAVCARWLLHPTDTSLPPAA